MDRRLFLRGLFAAPAIVPISSLMLLRGLILPRPLCGLILPREAAVYSLASAWIDGGYRNWLLTDFEFVRGSIIPTWSAQLITPA